MLCPEVWNFPAPNIFTTRKQYDNLDSISKVVELNPFYKNIIVTLPDELHFPSLIEELVAEDTDFYNISRCCLSEFIDENFIDNFVIKGNLYSFTPHTNSFVETSIAITPDRALTVSVLEHVYQTIGLQGTKRPFGLYELKIDLGNLKNKEKVKSCLQKLGAFDFNLIWEPFNEDICPSSIAKYFHDKNITVSLSRTQIEKVTQYITEIPIITDVEINELVEWIGMLAIGGDLNQKETYISTYSQPESDSAIKSTRITLLVARGFFTPTLINKLSEKLSEHILSRELENYWTALSIQTYENSLLQRNFSSPRTIQGHDYSCNIFFTHKGQTVYTVGQIKYS